MPPKRAARAASATDGSSDSDDEKQVAPSQSQRKRKAPSEQAPNPVSSGKGPRPFVRGAIRRVKMHNFLTYGDAEVYPGPALNLILGPNGTGKSSVVCAICLGLGGDSRSLGRAKELKDYVKAGEKNGYIEIELHQTNDDGSNTIIRRDIHDDNSNSFTKNGKKSNQKEIKLLCSRLHIQVDNLCCFLAQDKVVEFARLQPQELLVETEKAINLELYESHKELVAKRKAEKDIEKDLQKAEADFKHLEERLKHLQTEMDRYRAREENQRKVQILVAKQLWLEYEAARQEYARNLQMVKDLQETLKKLQEEQQPMRRRLAQIEPKYNRVSQQLQQAHTQLVQLEAQQKELVGQLSTFEDKVGELRDQMESEKKEESKRQQKIKNKENELEKVQKELEALPENTEWEEKKKELEKQRQALRDRRSKVQESQLNCQEERRRLGDEAKHITNELQRLSNVKEQRMDRANKFSRGEVKRSYDWVQQHRHELRGEIWGPVFNEVNVPDPIHARMLETHIPIRVRLAFVVENKEDYLRVSEGFKSMGVRTMIVSVSRVGPRPPPVNFEKFFTPEEIRRMGWVWMEKTIQGPEPILQLLADFHKTNMSACVKTELGGDTVSRVVGTASDKGLLSIYTPTIHYGSKFSRYGTHSVSTRMDRLKPAEFFAGVDLEQKTELENKLAELAANDKEYVERLQSVDTELKELDDRLREIAARISDVGLEERKRKTVEQKVRRLEQELNELKKGGDIQKRLKHLQHEIEQFMRLRIDKLLKLVTIADQAAEASIAADAHRITQAALVGEREQAQRVIRNMDQLETANQTRLQNAERVTSSLKEQALRLKGVAETKAPFEEWKGRMQESWVPQNLDEVRDASARCQAAADAVAVDFNVVNEYKTVSKEFEEKKVDLETKRIAFSDSKESISKIEEEYLPHVQSAIERVNTRFKQYYDEMGCKGEVELMKDNPDFDKWELQIRVAYRANSDLEVLSGTRQSGGERSVATMMYLLCLQQVTDTPFRLVDEINQGMDPHNERHVFDCIVRGSEEKETSPQYFLVTPKLLPNLRYTEHIAVHFVYNGPWITPQKAWDDATFVRNTRQKAKNDADRVIVSRSAGAGAASRPADTEDEPTAIDEDDE